jgi:hypothetical protein
MRLTKEQADLLAMIVDAHRRTPPTGTREPFLMAESQSGWLLMHPQIDDSEDGPYVFLGDVESLRSAGLIAYLPARGPLRSFYITNAGLEAHDELAARSGRGARRVETVVGDHLNSDRFRSRYPAAHDRWSRAEALIWIAEPRAESLTTVGHLLREAMQEFATVLVERVRPQSVDADKAHTKSRLRAVVNTVAAGLGEAEIDLLNAAVEYWAAVNLLVQRQEHGGQKGGKPLVWNDARRAVFHTAMLMYELDAVVGR